jgi:hypothetical protein
MDRQKNCIVHASLLLAALSASATAWASFVYDEAVDGDLSGDGLSPTVLVADVGSNSLTGTTGTGDLDYLTFNVASGLRLDAVILAVYDSIDQLAFIAIQNGSTFTEPPVGTDPANLLGWVHFGPALVGTDILDDMGLGDGAIGFTPPLPSGDYSFWIQQTGVDPVDYQMHFVLSPVPVPAALPLLASGLLALGGCARARRRGGKP